MSTDWPPALKKFVNDTFAACTDANRAQVETELKQVIFKAFNEKTMWSIDWPNYKLEALKKPVIIPSAIAIPTQRKTGKRKKAPLAEPISAAAHAVNIRHENEMRNKRARRFELASNDTTASASASTMVASHLALTPEPEYNPDVIDWDKYTIVGTSQTLEKPYLRLTSVPDPANVRPISTLRQTLELLKKKWRTENNYGYICDQFKSMRQDLTVQRIKNDFTVSVYEIHARIALEKGDLGEYNQCQSQLKDLYTHGLEGHPLEFLAYRILYLLHTRNRREINALLSNLTPTERIDECVQHALQVRLALATSNYKKFFNLFCSAPKMGGYMMDHFIPRERVTALVTMTKAYISLPLTFIASQLAFDSVEEVHTFLIAHQAAFFTSSTTAQADQDPRLLDCKNARPGLVEALSNYTKVDIKGQI